MGEATMTTLAPRLMDAQSAAAYVGVARSTFVEWVAMGHIQPVELPERPSSSRNGRFRRVLFDVRDLDAFIDARKAAPHAHGR